MTLDIFENQLRLECQRLYVSLKDGSRSEKLKNKKVNSLTDVVFIGRDNPTKICRSCIITFGSVLENSAMNYAKAMDAKVFRNKKLLSSDIDILFQIKNIIHHLESKANIELDNEKTKKALDSLQRKHKVVFNALCCHDQGWQVVSKFVVWTKEDSIDAAITAKHPLESKHLMGFKDYFMLFGVEVTKDDFFNVIQKVWVEEVEAYL
ncbi:hypothetical protein GQ473_06150 [archaeon]|nr:hypothetical protein [archaeon]